MVRPPYIPVIIRKKKYRAGKKKRASRLASHLRWVERQAFETQSKVEPTKKISSIPVTSASTSQSETLTSPLQETFNPESGFDTKITNNFVVNLPATDNPNDSNTYLSERKVSQEPYQNATNLEGNVNEPFLSEDFISQLNSLLPDELLSKN